MACLLSLCVTANLAPKICMFVIAEEKCGASLRPFSEMRKLFFDGIEDGKPKSNLEDKVYTISLGEGISVVMKKWKVYERV